MAQPESPQTPSDRPSLRSNPETEPDPLPPLGNASDDVLEYPDVALPQEAANDVTKNQETEEGGFDDTTLGDQNFETPPRKTELVCDDEATEATRDWRPKSLHLEGGHLSCPSAAERQLGRCRLSFALLHLPKSQNVSSSANPAQ